MWHIFLFVVTRTTLPDHFGAREASGVAPPFFKNVPKRTARGHSWPRKWSEANISAICVCFVLFFYVCLCAKFFTFKWCALHTYPL